MGISIQEYRQRIGCFKVRGYKRNTFTKHMTFSNDFGNALLVIIRLSCLVAIVAAVIPSSSFVLDLTQFGDVEKNPGPDQDYKFHLINNNEFEKLAVTVLGYIYNIKTLSTFSTGKDCGLDAAANGVDINLGGGNILRNQNLGVQVMHTRKESSTISNTIRKIIFEKEKERLKRLVLKHQLDTYIMLTNYNIPASQSDKLEECFKSAGAKNVIIIGKETLSQWLNDSPELQRKVIFWDSTTKRARQESEPGSTSESCESPTSKRPRQESEPRSTVDIGDNITGSTSEPCKSPTPKRLRQESEPMSTADNEDNTTEILSNEYKDRAGRHHPLPWLDKTQFDLNEVYTTLGIVQRKNKSWQLTNKTVELSDIFDKHEYMMCEDTIRTILIEGSPGVGKTTLSLKLASDWAMGRMPSKFPPIELVLLIKCRDMKGDILEAINEQLFPIDEDSSKEKLRKFIQEHPEKILLVVDGLDEIPEAATEHVIMNLLTPTCLLRKCYLVATSRQEKGLKVRQYFDTLLEIKGYSPSDIEEYITRYFQDNDPSLGERLIENLKADINLQTLATNPLNTVLLCVIFEYYDGKLASTVTELYADNIAFCITKRYCEKNGLKVEDSVLETAKETLGELAYKGLLEDTLSFRESELSKEVIHCTKMGFLYKEVSKQKIKQDHTYWFLHKTFQEYFSAFYLTEKVKRQELTVKKMIEQLKDTTRFGQVLKFISGMLHKKDAVLEKAFMEELKRVLSQSKDDIEVLCILCAVLSDNPIDKDVAGIIHPFLPERLLLTSESPYGEYLFRILPRILNLLCTKEGINKEVKFEDVYFLDIEISTSDLRLICKALKEKLQVTILDLDMCSLRDEIAGDLSDMLSHNSTVEMLNLAKNYFTAEAAKILPVGPCQNSTLKELYLDHNQLGNVGVKAIMASLAPDTCTLTALHTLSLSHTGCGEQSAFAVAEMLRTNNRLKTLDMSENLLGWKGVTSVAEALESNGALNSLDLRNTDCGNKGAAALAEMLWSNETLEELFICNFLAEETEEKHNKVGKDGAVALAGALLFNTSLKYLHLSNNLITERGVEYLAKALLGNTKLKKLHIRYPGGSLMALDQGAGEKVKERITWSCNCLET